MANRTQPRPRPRQAGAGNVKKWLARHRLVASTSAKRLLENPVSSLLTVFVIAVSLLLPALLFTVNASLSQLLERFQEDRQITLYLLDSINDNEALQISEDLLTTAGVSTVDFISRTQGLREFSAASGLGEVLLALPDNPLPATIVITPVSSDPDQIGALAASLANHPGVELAQVDSLWLQRLAAISQLVSVVGSGLSLIVVLGLFVIVGNTIKLAIENRRREISVIKLVGGTDSFIARPFLYSGLLYGAAGGVLATILQLIVLFIFNSPLQELMRLYDGSATPLGVPVTSALLTVSAGAAIGWSAALIASLRHIRSLTT